MNHKGNGALKMKIVTAVNAIAMLIIDKRRGEVENIFPIYKKRNHKTG